MHLILLMWKGGDFTCTHTHKQHVLPVVEELQEAVVMRQCSYMANSLVLLASIPCTTSVTMYGMCHVWSAGATYTPHDYNQLKYKPSAHLYIHLKFSWSIVAMIMLSIRIVITRQINKTNPHCTCVPRVINYICILWKFILGNRLGLYVTTCICVWERGYNVFMQHVHLSLNTIFFTELQYFQEMQKLTQKTCSIFTTHKQQQESLPLIDLLLQSLEQVRA